MVSKQKLFTKLDLLEMELEERLIPHLEKSAHGENDLVFCVTGFNPFRELKSKTDKVTEELEMKWISLKWYTKINEVMTEITYDIRKDGITVKDLTYKNIDNKKTFKIGQKIEIDINEFNGVAYTCAEFAKYIYSSMPKM